MAGLSNGILRSSEESNLLFLDLFIDSNGTPLATHNSLWSIIGSASPEIQGNRCVPGTLGQLSRIIQDTGVVDIILSGDIEDSAEGSSGLMLRYVDTDNYIVGTRWNSSTYGIAKREAGVNSLIASFAFSRAAGLNSNTVEITVSGDDISMLTNGSNLISVNTSFNNGATQQGFSIFANAGATLPGIDNIQCIRNI